MLWKDTDVLGRLNVGREMREGHCVVSARSRMVASVFVYPCSTLNASKASKYLQDKNLLSLQP